FAHLRNRPCGLGRRAGRLGRAAPTATSTSASTSASTTTFTVSAPTAAASTTSRATHSRIGFFGKQRIALINHLLQPQTLLCILAVQAISLSLFVSASRFVELLVLDLVVPRRAFVLDVATPPSGLPSLFQSPEFLRREFFLLLGRSRLISGSCVARGV